MADSVIVEFENRMNGEKHDLEIPTYIKVIDLLRAIDTVYHLGIDFSNPSQLFLLAENPPALMENDHYINEYGLHNGTKLFYKK